MTVASSCDAGHVCSGSQWVRCYSERHAWRRVKDLPAGVIAPKRVRIYHRAGHYMLQAWDPSVKRNVTERVDGDLVAAISRARDFEERLENHHAPSRQHSRLRHTELIVAFVADLSRRANAREIDARTVRRYQSALAHYERFAEQPRIAARYPHVARIDRAFSLEFAAYLSTAQANHAGRRPMTSTNYVETVVAAMFNWASDAEQGGLLPDGFRHGFAGRRRRTTEVQPDLFGEPDITAEMAREFLTECDRFQLPLFALLVLYGLRPSELTYLFRENIDGDWLSVVCDTELGIFSKGRRNKRLPLIVGLPVTNVATKQVSGLLFVRRSVAAGTETPPLFGTPLQTLHGVFAERSAKSGASAAKRAQIRDSILREAGGLDYDHIEHEFRRISNKLSWPRAATIKDFRHLFNTLLQNAAMPEVYRRYLMGHSPGKSAIVSYTHVNELRQRYQLAVDTTLHPLVEAITARARRVGLLKDEAIDSSQKLLAADDGSLALHNILC